MNRKDINIPDTLSGLVGITTGYHKPGMAGAVVARPGVGKTPFLVQVALHAMMAGRNVMHVNLQDPIKKVAFWYEQIFSLLRERHHEPEKFVTLDSLVSHRFIMTMHVSGFSVEALGERVSDLVEQDLFVPDMLVIDGLPFGGIRQEMVEGLKKMGLDMNFGTWLSFPVHREEERGENNMPVSVIDLRASLDFVWELVPDGRKIHVRRLKDDLEPDGSVVGIYMDPSTMLLAVS